MFDTEVKSGICLSNARIVLPGRVHHGSLTVEQGMVGDLGTSATGVDLQGDYLIPGIIDLHTDHVESQLFPRAGVTWKFADALAAHDGVVIAGGTTTVFDSLCVGATIKKPERRDVLLPLLDALEAGARAGRFRAEHFLHLRCETCDPKTIPLFDQAIARNIARLVSVMDHTPGDRQSVDVGHWTTRMARDMQIDLAEARLRLAELLERSAAVSPSVRAHVIAGAKTAGLPILSHDDRTISHIDQACKEGISVSEFPTTPEAAAHARASGQSIVAGAPNYLRGGSQSGNVAVRELLAAGLVDALASDYVPRSPLDAAFAIAEDVDMPQDLPEAIAMVTEIPARIAGLTDRGAIRPGLQADLVQVRRGSAGNHVVAVWRRGQRVF